MPGTHEKRIGRGLVAIGVVILTATGINLFYMVVMGIEEGHAMPLEILFPLAVAVWPFIYAMGMLLGALDARLEGWTVTDQ